VGVFRVCCNIDRDDDTLDSSCRNSGREKHNRVE
jgi:hypothetical protein